MLVELSWVELWCQVALLDDEDRIHDAYELFTSLKMIALQRQIRQRQKELDKVQYAHIFAVCYQQMSIIPASGYFIFVFKS